MLSPATAASTGTERPGTGHVETQTVRQGAWTERGGGRGGGTVREPLGKSPKRTSILLLSPVGLYVKLEVTLEKTKCCPKESSTVVMKINFKIQTSTRSHINKLIVQKFGKSDLMSHLCTTASSAVWLLAAVKMSFYCFSSMSISCMHDTVHMPRTTWVCFDGGRQG